MDTSGDDDDDDDDDDPPPLCEQQPFTFTSVEHSDDCES